MSTTKTEIAWTDRTWNPTRGCSRVSLGCGGPKSVGGCYAEKVAYRFSGPGLPYEGLARMTASGPRWTGVVRLIPEALDEPLRWRKPQRIFVNSMSDLFHESLPDEAIDQVFAVMARAHWHTFQILTKRPARMLDYLRPSSGAVPRIVSLIARHDQALAIQTQVGVRLDDRPAKPRWPLPNVWCGASVEDQATANARIAHLEHVPAAVRFISYEPALGPIDFTDGPLDPESTMGEWSLLDRLDWVIVGGESGPGARPFDLAWARSTVAACKAAGVPCFVKQLGARPGFFPGDDVTGYEGIPQPVELRNRKGGDPEEWPADLRVREFPVVVEAAKPANEVSE